MKRFALVLLLAAPAFAQSVKLTLSLNYPPAAIDPTNPIVTRVYHSPLIAVALTNWMVIAPSTNSTNFLIAIPATPLGELRFPGTSTGFERLEFGPSASPISGVGMPVPSEAPITSAIRLTPEMPSGARIVVAPNRAAGRDWPQETNPNDFTTTFYSKDGVMWKASWSTGQQVSPNQNDGDPQKNRRELEK